LTSSVPIFIALFPDSSEFRAGIKKFKSNLNHQKSFHFVPFKLGRVAVEVATTMDEATAKTAALFNAFNNAMRDGLNDLKQAILLPDLRKSSGSLLTEMPPAKRRAPLEDITITFSEPDPSDCRVESCPTSLTFARFQYSKKNVNKKRIEFICRYDRSKRKGYCKHARLYLPIVNGLVKYDKLKVTGTHTKGCCKAVGRDINEYDYYEKLQLKTDTEEEKQAVESHKIDITEEMHIRTCELAMDPKLCSTAPVQLWPVLKQEMDAKYPVWTGLQRESVMRLINKTRDDLGLGNSISTIENTLEYSSMKDAAWAFLRYSASMPVPNQEDKSMKFMVFGNPELIRLLKMPQVDLFMDATFDCCPHPFYQCLIIMVYNSTNSYYVPVLYILMTKKNEHLYWHAFNQVIVQGDWQVEVGTYTTDFERALMNQAEIQFGEPGKDKHVGCLFHLKQAWRRYLTKKFRMEPKAVKVAMEVGALDILSIIPRDEIEPYGIPYVRMKVESGQSEETVGKWDDFWVYFWRQWMNIVPSWNICGRDNE
jgi:hypothetical protein